MKFQLAINLERMADDIGMEEVARHTLEMVQMAEEGGFHIVWSAEHHALEMTIAPDPFQLLTWWGCHTNKIRLGTAVAVAAYWHPIKLAGEAAMTDLLTGGRLEFGIGSGAYQREFDRMYPGLKQSDAWMYMQEMLPAILELWKGDYEHNGKYWQFPLATSVPKPVQKPHPPLWVAARAPITYDFAVKHGLNIMSWPLTRKLLQQVISRIEIRPGNLKLLICRQALISALRGDRKSPRAVDDVDITTIDLPFHMRRRGVEAKLMLAGEPRSKPSQDATIIQLIRDVHRWLDSLTNGKQCSIDDLARHEGIPASEISRALQLAFLAPDITRSILLGIQPVDLTAQSLKRLGKLPACWQEQRRLLGMHDHACPTG